MIRRAIEMEAEIKEQMRGGKGIVTITHIMKQEDLGGKCRLVAKISMEPGCSIGPHVHEDEEEIFYIMKGTASINDNGTVVTVNTGDSVLTGGGASHSVENIGENTLEMVAVILLYN